jgi:hypothetical protein
LGPVVREDYQDHVEEQEKMEDMETQAHLESVPGRLQDPALKRSA